MSLVGQCVVCACPPQFSGSLDITNRDGEIILLSNSMLPFISQAQILLYLYFEISQSLINSLDSSRAAPGNNL